MRHEIAAQIYTCTKIEKGEAVSSRTAGLGNRKSLRGLILSLSYLLAARKALLATAFELGVICLFSLLGCGCNFVIRLSRPGGNCFFNFHSRPEALIFVPFGSPLADVFVLVGDVVPPFRGKGIATNYLRFREVRG